MPHRIKQIWDHREFIVDALHVNLPWSSTLAMVTLAELKDMAAIISIIIGTICTVIVTRHKTKKD